MANTYNNTTLPTTYFDDWKDSDHYHQMLFNTGRTLQARELTQMQTIINKDIQKFADNIFKDGAVVKPGGITINTGYEFIKLNTDTTAGGGATPTTAYVGFTITGATSGIVGRIVEVVAAVSSDPSTLYVVYTDLNNGTQLRFTPGETLNISGQDDVVVQTVDNTVNPAVGVGTQANVGDGQYYVQGHFVYAEKQSIVFAKYTPTITDTLVFKITEDVVTTADDTGLFDNSGGTPNLTAPGADRYRIRLILDALSNINESTQNHVKIAVVRNSEVIREININDAYNIPADLIAKRIFENSGDYIIKPYTLAFEEDSANTATTLDAIIGPGTASVSGYRVISQFDTTINIPRAQETDTIVGEQVATQYGNYVKVSSGQGDDSGDILGLPNLSVFLRWNLHTNVALGGAKAGHVRVKAITEDGAAYRFHLMDIDLNDGINFRNIKSIGDSSDNGNFFNIVQEDSKTVLYETEKNSLLFDFPYTKPLSLANISITTQKRFTGTSSAGGALTITVADTTNETFANTNSWIVVRKAGAPDTSWTIGSGGAGATSAVFAGLDASLVYEIYAYVTKASAVTSRTKTIVTSTVTGIADATDSDGNVFYSLGQPDIFELDSVRIGSSAGVDVKNRVLLDNGQRDNFYDTGRIVIRGGETAPDTIYAKFKHFEHGATGDFFSTRSYVGQVDYNRVPSYRKSDGRVVNLNDVIDFRAVKQVNGTFASLDARVHSIPAPTDTVEADVTYYLPRSDKLIIGKDGVIEYVEGLSSFNPTFPETPSESMLLHRITLNAYTLNDSDLSIEKEEHRRYTMTDIGNLDRRLDNLEETSALTTLETDLSLINVLDATGVIRPKAGFFVDNFATDAFSDMDNIGYRASIDPQNKVLRPSFQADNIRLVYDSDKSTNTIKKGSTVFLNHTETTFQENPFATGISNINPFDVIVLESNIQISPSTDEWREKEYSTTSTTFGPDRIRNNLLPQTGLAGGNRNINLFNNWQWNWAGTSAGTIRERTARVAGNKRVTTTQTIVSSEAITQVVNERLLETTFSPFMRSRLIHFKVEGLRPNSRMYAYFDDRHVEDWVRTESSFVEFGATTSDYGNTYNSVSQHPFSGGPNTLTTDATGKLIGSFFLPNTSTFRFRTGSKQFKVLDIAPEPGQSFRAGTNGALSIGTTSYTATGVLERYEADVISYRRITIDTQTKVTRVDPIAQSFFVDEEKGIWVTKIGIRFATKPAGGVVQVPVTMQIRPLVNGYPASNSIIQGAEATLVPGDITTSADATTITYFVFTEPVYLEGDKDFAFVLLANTTAYNVYISETEKFRIGSSTARVAKQPVLGSFFSSQNANTWSADQTKDITFDIQRGEFVSSGTAFLRNAEVPFELLVDNPFEVFDGDSNCTVFLPNHGLEVSDVVQINGVDSTDSAAIGNLTIGGVAGSVFTGTQTITAVDGTGFRFKLPFANDSVADSDAIGGGNRVAITKNIPFTQAWPAIDIFQPPSTLVNASGRFTTGKSLAGAETSMAKPTAYSTIFLNESNYFTNPKVIANRITEVAQLTDAAQGDRSFDTKVVLTSANSTVSPAIDLQRSSLTTIYNVIDKQDSAATSGFNVPFKYSPETAAWGGSTLAKHITREVALIETATGIKVIVAANRPKESDFRVYYRVGNSDADLNNEPWILQAEDTFNGPNEDETVYNDYEYLVGALAGSIPAFSKFQLKIEMRSTNNAKVPTFKNLRVIALSE